MTRRHLVAVAVAIATMLVALVPPLWVRTTGDEVYLEIRPVDPLSLFRGNYVDLRYDVPVAIPAEIEQGDAVYVVVTTDRPARIVGFSASRPSLGPDERCLRGRAAYDRVEFPHLEQFFVTPEKGRSIERDIGQYLAVVKVTGRCNSILVDLELE